MSARRSLRLEGQAVRRPKYAQPCRRVRLSRSMNEVLIVEESSDSNRSCSIFDLVPMIDRRSTLMTRFFRRFLMTSAYKQIESKRFLAAQE